MSKIESGSTNVYADLGMADAEEMLVKTQLAAKIGDIIKWRRLTKFKLHNCWALHNPSCPAYYAGSFVAYLKPRCWNVLPGWGEILRSSSRLPLVRERKGMCLWYLRNIVFGF